MADTIYLDNTMSRYILSWDDFRRVQRAAAIRRDYAASVAESRGETGQVGTIYPCGLVESSAVSGQTWRLVRRGGGGPVEAPVLDAYQRAVVDHESGPLLVLAGPGTGKTTTIVETVVDRIERRGLDPERVLILTFSRKAAGELRERITGRMRRTTRTPWP